jgi:hypothetical protein
MSSEEEPACGRLEAPRGPRGQAPKLVTGRHHLFHGELSDAPGRNESWDQFLCYQENNRGSLSQKGLTSPVLLSLRRPNTP